MDSGSVEYPRVSVVTLNWNSKDDTLECVASLKKLNYPAYDIIVVDNGSADGSVSALRASHPDITVIENGKNLGYGAGFDVGLAYAFAHGAEYCLILNNDTVIDPEALTELLKMALQDERIGFVSGKVYWYGKPNTLQTTGRYNDPVMLIGPHVGTGEVDHGQYDQVRDYDFVDDVFLLVRRQVYEQVGGYDPLFFLYFEETDWCARVRRAGFRIVYTPGAKIWHKGTVGKSDVPLNPQRVYYLQRYEVPFMRRNATPTQWHAYLRRVLFGLPRRILGYAKHGRFATMFAYLRGLGAGMSWVWHSWRSNPSAANGQST